MPSGNAIYTYTGPDEHVTIQGQVFLKDEPKHMTDQGVIAVCAGRKDFIESITQGEALDEIIARAQPIKRFIAAEFDEATTPAIEKFAAGVVVASTPAKPKKAKSK